MKLLLDTHVALWTVTDDPRLSRAARKLVADFTHEKCVSIVSLWEIGLKRASKPSRIPLTSARAILLFEQAGFEHVPLEPEHVTAFEAVPLLHGDPFDRMIVAQALHENLRLVTHDEAVAGYSNTFLLV